PPSQVYRLPAGLGEPEPWPVQACVLGKAKLFVGATRHERAEAPRRHRQRDPSLQGRSRSYNYSERSPEAEDRHSGTRTDAGHIPSDTLLLANQYSNFLFPYGRG